ncbi:hypothetical protein EBO34_02685 [Alteribacter keqinensis]|uniref:YqfQ-like protein n=2 Tax=Alteribacter keqinensis TaxID=2483800 RepID=A0A3M7TUI1_9BACI|nr:hypothetical protein EBO34_02685 [Alteribacter keqinensis]
MFGPRPLPPGSQSSFSPFMRGPGPGAGMFPVRGAAGPFGGSAFGPPQQAAMRQGGGLLSRLFGGGAQAAGSSAGGFGSFGGFGSSAGAGASAGAGPLASLTNAVSSGGGINSVLGLVQNAQKAVQVVQTVGPMVQQYGPLVKSLPQLMAIMRASDSDDESAVMDETDHSNDTDNEEVVEINKPAKVAVSKKKPSFRPVKKRRNRPAGKKTEKNPGISKKDDRLPGPKLYV